MKIGRLHIWVERDRHDEDGCPLCDFKYTTTRPVPRAKRCSWGWYITLDLVQECPCCGADFSRGTLGLSWEYRP